MGEDRGSRRFCFAIAATARVTVEGVDARRARDALGRALDGATASVMAGPGSGLRLEDLRVSDDVELVLVDGLDPTAELRRLLDEHGTKSVGEGT